MKRGLDVATAPTLRPTRLDQCGDTLSITELCGVLGISRAEYFRSKAHRTFPLKPLAGFRFRYSKAQVQRYLERGA